MKIGMIGNSKKAAQTAGMFAGCKEVQVLLYDFSEEESAEAEGKTEDFLLDCAGQQRLTMEEVSTAIDRLTICKDRKELKDCDLILAISGEKEEDPCKVLKELDAICKPETIFAVETFALDTVREQMEVGREVIGMGFFHQGPAKDMVELIVSEKEHKDLVGQIAGMIRKMGKHSILGQDEAGRFYNKFILPVKYVCENLYFQTIGR